MLQPFVCRPCCRHPPTCTPHVAAQRKCVAQNVNSKLQHLFAWQLYVPSFDVILTLRIAPHRSILLAISFQAMRVLQPSFLHPSSFSPTQTIIPRAPTSPKAVIVKLLLDQLVMAPIGMAAFFASLRVMDGGSLPQVRSLLCFCASLCIAQDGRPRMRCMAVPSMCQSASGRQSPRNAVCEWHRGRSGGFIQRK